MMNRRQALRALSLTPLAAPLALIAGPEPQPNTITFPAATIPGDGEWHKVSFWVSSAEGHHVYIDGAHV